MALNRDKQFVFKNGEFAVAAGADFNAGGPLMVSGSGVEADGYTAGLGYLPYFTAMECSNDHAYIGIALQDSEDAVKIGKVTFYSGVGLFTLEPDVISGSKQYPWDESRRYDAGDPIVINTSTKKWTNDTGTYSSGKVRGTVVAVGVDSLTILFNA